MNANKPLVVCVGEILWDVLPTGKALGGAPANVAWHAAQLGADSRIVSAVGADEPGREILDRLRLLDMNCEHLFVVDDRPTSLVDAVISEDGVASYVIRPDVAWDCIPTTSGALDLIRRADAINFGSLVQRYEPGRRMIQACLDAARPECLKLFDVNLRPGCIRREVLEEGFARCDIVKLNAEELLVVAEMFNWPGQSEKVLDRFLEDYPNIGHVIVTRGADGMWWKTAAGLVRRPGRAIRVADTIGAGDSVTAAVVMGILRKMEPPRIIERALDISGFVCTHIGATPALPENLTGAFRGDACHASDKPYNVGLSFQHGGSAP